MKDVADLSNHFNQLRVLRGMTPNQRLVATLELSEFTRALFAEGLRRRYPHLTDGEFDAPEDTILAKLRWAHLAGGSEKHLADAIRVYELQYPILDRQYLDRWVDALDIDELWRQLLSRAMPLE